MRHVKIDIGPGLKDGKIAGANARRAQLMRLGVTDISVASTGRLTFTFDGARYTYSVRSPRDRREADEFERAGSVDSPMNRAIHDLTERSVPDMDKSDAQIRREINEVLSGKTRF